MFTRRRGMDGLILRYCRFILRVIGIILWVLLNLLTQLLMSFVQSRLLTVSLQVLFVVSTSLLIFLILQFIVLVFRRLLFMMSRVSRHSSIFLLFRVKQLCRVLCLRQFLMVRALMALILFLLFLRRLIVKVAVVCLIIVMLFLFLRDSFSGAEVPLRVMVIVRLLLFHLQSAVLIEFLRVVLLRQVLLVLLFKLKGRYCKLLSG